MASSSYINQIIFNHLLEKLPYYIYWKDKNSIYQGCNRRFANAAGFRLPKEIIGKSDYDLAWGKSEADAYRADDKRLLNGEMLLDFEEEQLRADGKHMIVLASKVLYHDDDGHVLGILGIYSDITERKQQAQELIKAKQKAEVANQAKTEFITSMSHDLRTPLQVILMITEVLQKKSQTQELRKPLDTINEAGRELNQLVEEVLSFSKLESGKQELRPEIFCLREFLDQLNNMMQLTAEVKNISLYIDYSSDIPLQVTQDSMALRRILMNLLNNAIKFTEHGHVQLAVNVAKIENDIVWLQFKVSDTGIGIPSDKLESIFERFSRVESTEKKRYEGIGLGLAIVKQLVQGLGGEIQVSSELGKGSEFICLLPFELYRELK